MILRFARMAAAVAAIGVYAVSGPATAANAALLTSFSMSPTSGPGGTAVAVRGTGCAPGLLLSPSLDRVAVAFATVPSVRAQFPVNSAGAWAGTVTIPSNAAAGPAAVTALCVTDGLPSLLTIYQPETFTVTAAAAPPTTTPRPTTTTAPVGAENPPTTVPPSGHPEPPTTSAPGGAQPVAASPTPGGGGGPSVGGGSSPPGGSGSATSPGAVPAGSHVSRAAVAADLPTPRLTAASLSGGAGGLGWVAWLALALLLAGLLTGGLLFRKLRQDEHAPAAESPG